jgi:hypothetical protein
MLPLRKSEIASFRGDYASRADFCEVLEKEMKPLYVPRHNPSGTTKGQVRR